MDSSEKVSGKFIKALGEAAHILAATKEAFDDVALTVKAFVDGLRVFRILPIGNNWHGSIITDGLTYMLAVISFIGTDR